MRVLYFSQDYSPHDHRFLAALAGTEHEVFYLRLLRNDRRAEDRPVPSQIQQVLWARAGNCFRWRDVPRLRSQLKQIIREVRPNLIHAGPIQTCAFLSALAGFRPLLTMSWGFDLMQDAEKNAWWRWVTRYTLQHSDVFVSDAEVTRQKAVARGVRANRTFVFPWGVDLQRFTPAVARHPSSDSDPGSQRTVEGSDEMLKAPAAPFVLFCSRTWEALYGIDVLARAFVKVARKRPDVSLLLLGEGSMGPAIRQILMSGGVLDRVQFPGRVAQGDLPRWYRMASLYISPSHVDGSSVSLLEALATGLPVLVSDIPGNREWVTEGVNGWLFPDGDSDALAEKILRILESPIELAAAGQHSRRRAEERADWSKNFRVLLQAYQQAAPSGM